MELEEIYNEEWIWSDDTQDIRGKKLKKLLKYITEHGVENVAIMYDDQGLGLALIKK